MGASLQSMRGLLFRPLTSGSRISTWPTTTGRAGRGGRKLGRILTTDLAAHRDEVIISTKAG